MQYSNLYQFVVLCVCKGKKGATGALLGRNMNISGSGESFFLVASEVSLTHFTE